MNSFGEFLLARGEFTLFEATAFCQDIFDKLSPEDREEFIQFIKNSDAENIMRLIKKVTGVHNQKGHKKMKWGYH